MVERWLGEETGEPIHASWYAGRPLLVTANDIDVVGDSGSARESVPQILRLDVDVVLLDLHLQDGSGIEVCRAVRAVKPSVSGLLLTASGDDEASAATVLAGAAGYLVKLSRTTDIIGTIRRLRPGVSLLEEETQQRARRLLTALLDSQQPALPELERRIVELAIAGRTDAEVAAELDGQLGPDAEVSAVMTRVAEALLRERRPGWTAS